MIDYAGWLGSLDPTAFERMANAAETVLTIQEALSNEPLSLLGELLRDEAEGPIRAWTHYPDADCRDPQSGAMFYYHAHDPDEWKRDEHGHFHLFFRPQADGPFTHIMALSMNARGLPVGLFATNGWVTDETMQSADRVLQRLDAGWEINRARPSWLVAQWLNAMVNLLRPHADALLRQRDRVIATGGSMDEETNPILMDRNTHVLGELPLELPAILRSVQEEALKRL
jgi:hypothetical protein